MTDHSPSRAQAQAPHRRPQTRLAFHASRIIIDIGVLITLGSMSMPFVTTSAGERSAIVQDALPALLLVIPIFLITLLPDHTRPVPAPLGWVGLVLGVAAFPYAIVKFLDADTVAVTTGGTVGVGARLLVFGTFVTLLGIVIGLARRLFRLPAGGTYPAKRPPAAAMPQQRPPTATQGAARASSDRAASQMGRPGTPMQGGVARAAGAPRQGTPVETKGTPDHVRRQDTPAPRPALKPRPQPPTTQPSAPIANPAPLAPQAPLRRQTPKPTPEPDPDPVVWEDLDHLLGPPDTEVLEFETQPVDPKGQDED